MTSLTIKDVPPELLEALRTAAIEHGRSLDQQIIHLLEATMEAQSKSRKPLDADARVNALRALAGQWRGHSDP